MKERCKKLINILKIELEDLIEDIVFLGGLYEEREKKKEITHYVLLENSGLLKQEASGIKELVDSLNEIKTEDCTDLMKFSENIDFHLKEKCKSFGYPDVVYLLAKRRLQKVIKYIAEV